MSFRRIAAFAGLTFVALIVINAILQGDSPTPTDSIDEVGRYYASDTDAHKIGAIAGYLVALPAVVFFAGLLAPYRATDRTHGEEWSTVMLLSVTVLAASAGTGDVLNGSLIYRGGAGLDAGVARGLFDAQGIAYTLAGVGVAGITGSAAISGWMHKLAPSWYVALSALVAVLGVLSVIGAVSTDLWIFGLLAFIGLVVWSLVTAILMLRDDAPLAMPAAA